MCVCVLCFVCVCVVCVCIVCVCVCVVCVCLGGSPLVIFLLVCEALVRGGCHSCVDSDVPSCGFWVSEEGGQCEKEEKGRKGGTQSTGTALPSTPGSLADTVAGSQCCSPLMFTGKREEERGAEASEEPQEEGDHGQVGETQRCVLWSEVARLCSYVSWCSVASLCDPEVTGIPSVGFREEDLEEDFDPARYDETMCRVFSEQYDSMPVDTEKPVFSDSEGEGEFISTMLLH